MKSRSLFRHCFVKGVKTVALPADGQCPGKTTAFAQRIPIRAATDRPRWTPSSPRAAPRATRSSTGTARFATLAGADKIVVLQGGAVAEEGRHAELMAKGGGVYRGLALAQQAGAER
jgi:hypothetical protein